MKTLSLLFLNADGFVLPPRRGCQIPDVGFRGPGLYQVITKSNLNLNFNKNILLRKEVFGAKQAIPNIIGFVIVVGKLVSFMIRSVSILNINY